MQRVKTISLEAVRHIDMYARELVAVLILRLYLPKMPRPFGIHKDMNVVAFLLKKYLKIHAYSVQIGVAQHIFLPKNLPTQKKSMVLRKHTKLRAVQASLQAFF